MWTTWLPGTTAAGRSRCPTRGRRSSPRPPTRLPRRPPSSPSALAAGTLTAGGAAGEPTAAATIAVVEPAERALALHLLEYGATLRRVGELLEPHRLCGYLFELAQLFTSFYDQCPVLKADDSVRESRLALCALVLHRLSEGLDLLGIETPANM